MRPGAILGMLKGNMANNVIDQSTIIPGIYFLINSLGVSNHKQTQYFGLPRSAGVRPSSCSNEKTILRLYFTYIQSKIELSRLFPPAEIGGTKFIKSIELS